MEHQWTLIIVVVTYIGIAIGSWPKIKSNRATVALMGVGLLLVSGQIPFEKLPSYLDFDTLILLFSMMIINANLKLAGFFTLAGNSLLKVTRSPRFFLLIEIVLVGILSALFLNDTICLMLTPFILTMMTAVKRNPIPYLIALATASNIGSVATLTGNPQNMIVGVASGILYLNFTAALLPVALLGLGMIWLVLVWLYPAEFSGGLFSEIEPEKIAISRWSLIKNVGVVLGLLVAFLAGVPVAEAAFLAACVLLFTRRVQPHLVFAEFDWGLLVFFSGLFIVSGSLESSGLTKSLFDAMSIKSDINMWTFSGLTVVLSNLVSNVPAVLLLKSVVQNMAQPEGGWLTLAAASTLAGNMTLLGSVANLIVAEIASRWRVEISFWEYTRAGFIITILSLITGLGWMQLFLWR
ncbi:MAG TPA: anion transporter [Anaerolineaceae bacterium]|nr:anion transporter [Anaerolineaceae bacterium]HPN52428.1 anion transporter [Anaerolineaceae bacterium]